MSEMEKIFREKIEQFLELKKEMTDEAAYEKMLEGYPERQKKYFSEFIGDGTLAQGFTKAIAFYKQIGMEMEVVDVSNNGMDAVIEIQKVCPHTQLSQEYGVDPCRLLCDMDLEATRRAFPEWKADYIARQTEGDCICAYKYERKT